MSKLTVAGLWEKFERDGVHPHAGPHMRKALKRAFYAGAWSITDAAAGAMSPGTEVRDDDLSLAESLMGELKQFILDVRDGKA